MKYAPALLLLLCGCLRSTSVTVYVAPPITGDSEHRPIMVAEHTRCQRGWTRERLIYMDQDADVHVTWWCVAREGK